MESKDLLLSESHSQIIRRELDSLDDFEHLGHEDDDGSPLKEKSDAEKETIISAQPPPPKITDVDELSSAAAATFDPFPQSSGTSLFDQPLPKASAAPIMDTNLLATTIGVDKSINSSNTGNGDNKLDKFLDDMAVFDAPPPQSGGALIDLKHQDLPEHQNKDDFKLATQNFMDIEREQQQQKIGIIEPEKLSSTGNNDQLLERYTDSEPDDDDFKPSKDLSATKTITASNDNNDDDDDKHSKETFKDVDHYEKEFEPELPKKDYPTATSVGVNANGSGQVAPLSASNIVRQHDEIVVAPKPAIPTTTVTTPKECKVTEPKLGKLPEKVNEPICNLSVTKKVVTEAEAIFYRMGLDTWFNPERLNPKVESLIYWRDPKKSGPVFGGVLLILLALTYFSLISVVAYLSLIALTATISFRIYKNIIQAVQKTGDGHPFKELLEFDVALPQDKVKEISEIAVAHINAGVVELRRLFLVEDLVDSIKFGVLLWTFTYLGAWFNGMTLIIIAWIALFTLPKVYEANKTQIDANLEIVRTKLAEITSKVKAAIPIGKKTAPVVEEKKEQ